MIRPAGFLKRLFGAILPPTPITARVFAEYKPGSKQLSLSPHFFFGDELISTSEPLTFQTSELHGHRCVLEPSAFAVLSLLQRAPRYCDVQEAVTLMHALKDHKVAVMRPDGIPYHIAKGRFSGSVRQTESAEAVITANLVDDQGVVSERPVKAQILPF